ncbi:MAG: ABC transporter permease [Promethearchaeota archaeon]
MILIIVEITVKELKANWLPIWILAKREILGYWRAKSRVISSIAQTLIFLVIFGGGFFSVPIKIQGIQFSSLAFTASGMVGMVILFSGIFGGMGIIRDKLFGFMRELLIAPISRRTLMFGKTLGVAIQTLIQALLIVILSIFFGFYGFNFSLIWRVLLVIPTAILVSIGVVGMGLAIASRLNDFQGFGLIQTFIVMPMFLLSGALFPFNIVPMFLQIPMMLNPIFYGVDLFRAVLLGASYFPVWIDISVSAAFGAVLILLGARFFSKLQMT